MIAMSITALISLLALVAPADEPAPLRLLVFSKAAGRESVGKPGAKPEEGRLDPQAAAFLKKLKDSGAAGFETLPVEEARKAFLGMRELAGPPEPVGKVEDRTLPGGLSVRVYTPSGPGRSPPWSTSTAAAGSWARPRRSTHPAAGWPTPRDAWSSRSTIASRRSTTSRHRSMIATRRPDMSPSTPRFRGGCPADRRRRRQRRGQPGGGRHA